MDRELEILLKSGNSRDDLSTYWQQLNKSWQWKSPETHYILKDNKLHVDDSNWIKIPLFLMYNKSAEQAKQAVWHKCSDFRNTRNT